MVENKQILNNCNINPIDLKNAVILDTETTGLHNKDEICEISVIDTQTGKVIMDTLIKPSLTIPDEVIKIHGISNEDVANAPIYPEVHDQLMAIFKTRDVIIYNANFDLRLINQSASKYNLSTVSIVGSITCVMLWYAKFYRQWDDYRGSYKWQSLSNAAMQQDIDISDLKAHRAFADCIITQRIINIVNKQLKV